MNAFIILTFIFGVYDEITPLSIALLVIIGALFVYAVVKAFKEDKDED